MKDSKEREEYKTVTMPMVKDMTNTSWSYAQTLSNSLFSFRIVELTKNRCSKNSYVLTTPVF